MVCSGGSTEGLAYQITAAFWNGELDLLARPGAPSVGWSSLPEVVVCDSLRRQGTDDVAVRLFITFTAAMDRARIADRLWRDAGRLYAEVGWPFVPTEVAKRPLPELAEVLQRYGVSQRHSRDSAGWRRIGLSLREPSPSPAVWTALFKGTGDASVLLRSLLQVGAEGRPNFPFLRGPKVGQMWVRMLASPGVADIQGLESLRVAVDTHVRKVTEYLGVTKTRGQPLERVRKTIQEAWAEDVRRGGAIGPGALANTSAALDPALWFFGKWGCTHCEKVGRKVPIAKVCDACLFDSLFGV